MDKIIINQEIKVIEATKAMLNNSYFNDVAMCNVKIMNANLSDLEIEGAQIGGAYIHNIGGPPVGHPMHKPGFKQGPVRFENCDLNGGTFTNCNLSNVAITDSQVEGMTINGIGVDELLEVYRNSR